MRTTLDIDARILRGIKELQKKLGRSMGRIVTDLLADALARRKGPVRAKEFHWTSRRMRALVDLSDKEAVSLRSSGNTASGRVHQRR